MIDFFHLMDQGINVQKFFYCGDVLYQPWHKPKGAKMIYIFCLGAGAGGGGGCTRAAGNAGGGGGGGGTGGVGRLSVAADLIPDQLYIRIGSGGAGGVAGANGSQGGFTVINTVPSLGSAKSLLLASSVGNSVGGNRGQTTSGGSGGIGSTIATTTDNCLFTCLGDFVAYPGQTGANGGAQTGANGGSTTWGSLIVSSGAGGGGTTSGFFAGGDNTVATGLPLSTIKGGPSITSNGGNPGANGFTVWKPFCSVGGGGGSANNLGYGGAGGNGGLGSGGGGGGAGTTGGTGGRGGDGFALIVAI